MRLTILIAMMIASPVNAQVIDPAVAAADSFLVLLRDRDFAAAETKLAPVVKAQMPAAAMEALWSQLTTMGEPGAWTVAAVQDAQGHRVVDFTTRFGEQPLKLRVAIDGDGLVGGFFILPEEPPPYVPPAYVDTLQFREETLTVGTPEFPLGATLTIPHGPGPHPAIVLVHGSGPNDRDETIGPNRPFRDLAWGLASRGIAVLRYDKRTYVHAARMDASVTVQEEVIDDALSALDTLRAHAAIDSRRIFVLGHSLGGMLAPEIASVDAQTAGMISLAGSPRTLAGLIIEQLTYLGTLPDNASEQAQARILEFKQAAERVANRTAAPDEPVMGAPASYFYDMEDRRPAAHAAVLEVPMLFVQGGRDYQVTERDLQLWRELVGERPDVRYEFFPDLNHLFITGQGLATPTEYVTGSGHVDERVIDAIVSFVDPLRGSNRSR